MFQPHPFHSSRGSERRGGRRNRIQLSLASRRTGCTAPLSMALARIAYAFGGDSMHNPPLRSPAMQTETSFLWTRTVRPSQVIA